MFGGAPLSDLVIQGNCDDVLMKLPDGQFQLVYIDPPFNTGGTASVGC